MTRKHLISWWLWQPQKCTIQFPLQDRAGRCKCGVSWRLPEVRTVRAFSFWAEAALVLGNPSPMTKHHGGSRAWMFLLTRISYRSSSLWSPHRVCILVSGSPCLILFPPHFPVAGVRSTSCCESSPCPIPLPLPLLLHRNFISTNCLCS